MSCAVGYFGGVGAGELTARLAVGARQREDVFALRHESYLAGGYIDARPDGRFCDAYDDRVNCQSFAVYRGDRAVAAVRVCVLDAGEGWDDVPALNVFGEEMRAVMAARAPRGRAIEINRLVRRPEFSGDAGLVFVLFHLAGFMILRHDVDLVFSCVRENHVGFYRRLRFAPVAGPRVYAGLKFATRLMVCGREEFGAVRGMLPLLEGRAPAVDFGNMLDGRAVPVFGGL